MTSVMYRSAAIGASGEGIDGQVGAACPSMPSGVGVPGSACRGL